MGSGKTTIAQELARALHINMIEMDWMVLQSAGCKDMGELFNKEGEILLREWEICLAKEWRDLDDVVISAGGGVVMNKIIIDYLKEKGGKVIFLDAPFDVLHARIQQDKIERPLFKNREEAETLYAFRLPLYKRYADYQVMTDKKSIVDIVKEIQSIICQK